MIRWQGRYTKRNKGGHKKIQYQEETKNVGEWARARWCEIQYLAKIGTGKQIEVTA